MTQKWIDVKVPKDIIFVIILLFVLFNLGILFFIYLYTTRETSVQWKLLANIVGAAYILVGWGAPIYLYFHVPGKISFTDSEMVMKTRWGTIRKMPKTQIHNIKCGKTPVSKEFIYAVQYDIKNPEYALSLDKESGKRVWNWYYGEGQENEEQIED